MMGYYHSYDCIELLDKNILSFFFTSNSYNFAVCAKEAKHTTQACFTHYCHVTKKFRHSIIKDSAALFDQLLKCRSYKANFFLIKISSARFEWTLFWTYHHFDKVHWHIHWYYCHSWGRPTPPHTDTHIWILSLHILHTDRVKRDIHWSLLHTTLLCNLWKTEEITVLNCS